MTASGDNRTRVNLTLPDEVIAVLDRMEKVTGAGRATIIREWLIEALPQLGAMAHAMELASRKNVDAFNVITETLRKVSRSVDQMAVDAGIKRRAAMRKRRRSDGSS